MAPKDRTDIWIQNTVPGKTFVDVGGIGVDCGNERITFASKSGASRCTMADIRPMGFREWDVFHAKCTEGGIHDVIELADIDIRRRDSAARIGQCDVVHCTGVLYHVQSPPEVLWNLRSITGRHLITNTVTFPGRIENEEGVVELPDHGILFTAALNERERRVLDKYYTSKFGWGMNRMAPDPAAFIERPKWVENNELTCWPVWWLYTDHAFRSLLKICRLRVIDEWKWENHCLQVLCEISEDPVK